MAACRQARPKPQVQLWECGTAPWVPRLLHAHGLLCDTQFRRGQALSGGLRPGSRERRCQVISNHNGIGTRSRVTHKAPGRDSSAHCPSGDGLTPCVHAHRGAAFQVRAAHSSEQAFQSSLNSRNCPRRQLLPRIVLLIAQSTPQSRHPRGLQLFPKSKTQVRRIKTYLC